MDTSAKITVLVPLFPRQPGLQRSLASLRAQTLPPDLVVLLDDGSNPHAERLAEEIPDLTVTVAQVETNDVADGINHAVDFLEQTEYFAILAAGAAYAPARLERCLAAMQNPHQLRAPGLAVTGEELVDNQGSPLGADDPRHGQLERLWAPGRGGVSPSDWLGAGDFVLGPSNLFARRSYLTLNALAGGTTFFPYLAAIQAAVQGLLAVVDEPLISLNWGGTERSISMPAMKSLLRAQFAMLAALREKLVASPETRRNLAAFRRAAWNNISGLREDIFAQATMNLAAAADPDNVAEVVERLSGAKDFVAPPAHLKDLRTDESYADAAAYAAALAKTRGDLKDLQAEHQRLARVADAAQESGWVRFGAWLGDRSARRIMEMEKEENASIQPPDGEVEGGGENNPDEVGNKEP